MRTDRSVAVGTCLLGVGLVVCGACGGEEFNAPPPVSSDAEAATDASQDAAPDRVEPLDGGRDVQASDSQDTGTPDAPAAIPFDEAASRVAEVTCELFAECYGPAAPILQHGEDCVELFTQQLQNGVIPALETAIAGSTMVYHADLMQACLDSMRALGCEALSVRLTEACDRAFEGRVELGSPCMHSYECTGPYYCDFSETCPGMCTNRRSENMPCEVNETCQDGLLCIENQCAPPATLAGVCVYGSIPCGPRLICLPIEPGSLEGRCQDIESAFQADLGENCQVANGPLCSEGLSCNMADKVCVAAAESGGPCGTGFPDPCPDGSYCKDPPGPPTNDGTCTALPGDGEPCVLQLEAQCAPYHRCIEATCVALRPNGRPCSDPRACFSGSCVAGECAPPTC